MRAGFRLGRDEKIFLVVIAVFSVILGILIMTPGFLQNSREVSTANSSEGVVVGRETIEAGTPDLQVEGESGEQQNRGNNALTFAMILGGCLLSLGVVSGLITWLYIRSQKDDQQSSSDQTENESPRHETGRTEGGGTGVVMSGKQEKDPLRELPNRQDFLREILTALEEVERDFDKFALFIVKIHLDDTISIPSKYHHNLLTVVLRRLEEFAFENGIIARISSLEFAVIERGTSSRRRLGALSSRIMNEIKYPIEVDNREFKLDSNIAVGIYPEIGYNLKTILDNLKWTMEFSERLGKNEYKIFSEDVIIEIYDDMVLKNQLNTSLEKEEFEIYYQPIIDLQDKRIFGLEALLRWKHPNIGLIRPKVFLSLVEDTDMIIPIGAWVMERVCRDRLIWKEKWLRVPKIHINLSARQIHPVDLPRLIHQMNEEYDLKPGMLELEAGEHAIFEEANDGVTALTSAQRLGARVAVCGFGVPTSQLGRLQKMRFDSLKILRQFTASSIHTSDEAKIAPALIRLGVKLQLDVVAEGVENLLELQALMEYGIRYVQGYFIAEPMPEISIQKMLGMPFDEAFPHFAETLKE